MKMESLSANKLTVLARPLKNEEQKCIPTTGYLILTK